MKVEKEALGGQRVEPTEEELALVNRQSRKELTAAEVYLFAVRLCDNEVDRDGSSFHRPPWSSWRSCLWARAGSLTTGGAPAVRRPASTGRKWSGRRGYARRWESPPAI